MRITVAAAGRFKRDPTQALFDTYRTRCRWPIDLREVTARKAGDPAAVQAEEARQLLAAVPPSAALVALDARGQALSSDGFARWLADRRDGGSRDVAFAIGGADGLTDAVRGRGDLVLSFGAMTWPHMLVRVMLAEQIYRAQCILDGHPYHR
jgi:23S rRNA (pseudouridine1915-N3)-methyltransferase